MKFSNIIFMIEWLQGVKIARKSMTYTVLSTERTNAKASEYETKALLYLMNFRNDSNEMHYFVIDFFNDVTGIDSQARKAWDVQSKGSKKLSGKTIGIDLVTLFKNYLSDLNFAHFILFMCGVSETNIINKELDSFDISNFTERAKKSIKNGLEEAATEKSYINNNNITEENINDFLNKVTFVIAKKEKAEYVKKIIKLNSAIIPSDDYLNSIFNQIRDKQTAKKNICVENININTLRDFEPYKKYLNTNEIKLLVLSRLILKDSISKSDGVPLSFLPIVSRQEEANRRTFIEDCYDDIFRTILDKNNAIAYWSLFEEIYIKITQNPHMNVEEVYDSLDSDKLSKVHFLNFNSTMYFIAIIKDALKND